jgi:hypothetical protein
LQSVEAAIVERLQRLHRLVGKAGVDLILATVTDPAFKETLGLVAEREEDFEAGGGGLMTASVVGAGRVDAEEVGARVWRRRLDASKVQPARTAVGGTAARHDDATSRGARQVWNDLNRDDPESRLSYYQQQQVRYGRARRGSTSVAGAWEQVFASSPSAATAASSGQSVATASPRRRY